MTHIILAIPPQGAAPSAPVESGVYLRMGTYVDDLAHPVDEYSYMPDSFKTATNPAHPDASTSEGIFITSCGTYIVIGLDEAHVELDDTATLTLTGNEGSMTTTVSEGDIAITVTAGNTKIEGHSSFKVESNNSDISISAPSGKISNKGNYVYTHTYGYYIKIVKADAKSGTKGTDTNVSISLNLQLYGALLCSTNMGILSFKLATATITLFQLAGGGLNADFHDTARSYLMEDAKFALIYTKNRGFQLESNKAITEAKAADIHLGVVWLGTGISKAKMGGVKTAFGLTSEIPNL